MKNDIQKMLRVIDTSCTDEAKTRTHDIIVNGQAVSVTFTHGVDTILPHEQALKFMKDGFRVEELQDGYELRLPPVPMDNIAASLKPGECVATFEELTVSALKVRAAQKEGGEIYLNADDASKPDLIAFLKGEAPASGGVMLAPEKAAEPSEEDTSLIEDDSEDEAGKAADAAFQAKYGASFDIVIQALKDKFGANTWTGGLPVGGEAGVYTLTFDGTPVAIGTLDELIAAEGIKAPEPAGEERTFNIGEIKGATDEALELIATYDLDASQIVGTGEAGNILKEDVQAFIDTNGLQPKAS